jgi:hypothetical protein
MPNDFNKIEGGQNLTWGQQLNIMKAAIDPEAQHQQRYSSPQRHSTKTQRKTITTQIQAHPQSQTQNGKFKTYANQTLYKTEPLQIDHTIHGNLDFQIRPHQEVKHPNSYLKFQKPQQTPSNLTQLDMLEAHLSKIRTDLKPLIDKFNPHLPQGRSPHAELMELCTGRLLKVHSENLIELIIEELLMETVDCLNKSERERQKNFKKWEIKNLCSKMLQGLREIDIDQRHVYLGMNNMNTEEFVNNFGKTGELAQKSWKLAQRPLFDLGVIDYYRENEQIGEKREGPYKNRAGLLNRYENFVTIDSEVLMKLIRDQIMREDKLQEIPFMRKSYVESVKMLGDQIMNEVLEEILNDFSKVQDEFVNEVIKSEFT